jgi:hypothetical protein
MALFYLIEAAVLILVVLLAFRLRARIIRSYETNGLLRSTYVSPDRQFIREDADFYAFYIISVYFVQLVIAWFAVRYWW